MKPYVIAIDGPCGAGKTSLARALAKRLSITYLDTGAIFRICACYAVARNLDIDGMRPSERRDFARDWYLSDFDFGTLPDGATYAKLMGQDVTKTIRTQAISDLASRISTYPEIREQVLRVERNKSHGCCLVAEGRDIGTVVFPDAELKIYLTADTAERAKRRMLQSPSEFASLDAAVDAVTERDRRDMSRAEAPLRTPYGPCIHLDSTSMNEAQVLDCAIKLVRENVILKGMSFLPMNDKYGIATLVSNQVKNCPGMYGDLYKSMDTMLADHPGARPMFAFCVIDLDTGSIPPECADAHEQFDAAYEEYERLLKQEGGAS